ADPYPMKRSAITETLTQDGLSGADNWMFDAFSERLRYEVDHRWQGELPRTLLISADGSVEAIAGISDMNAVRVWIDAQGYTKQLHPVWCQSRIGQPGPKAIGLHIYLVKPLICRISPKLTPGLRCSVCAGYPPWGYQARMAIAVSGRPATSQASR